MAFWNRKEKRQYITTVDDILAGIISKSEITVEQALNVPALSSCVDFISQKVAELPVKLYRETENNTTEEVKNDRRVSLLNDETGDLLDCYQLKQAVVRDMLLGGTGYIYPEWRRNNVVSLRY
ncbi:MAG: phage portal protein, partial [Clostridia bacterium]|nr:phage portal protein [Clostridia bacterium]